MTAGMMLRALKFVEGAVSGDTDVVELQDTWVKATDKLWWTGIKLNEQLCPTAMILPYTKLRSIARTLAPESNMTVGHENVFCKVVGELASWKLNLREEEMPVPPRISADEILSSGFELAGAMKSLKHVVRSDLSRPSLNVAWANDDGYLVIGDGARLAARKCGVQGIQVPVAVAAELGRILSVAVCEEIGWKTDGKFLRVSMDDGYFVSKALDAEFEQEWYAKVRAALNGKTEKLVMPRSELMRGIAQVMVTAVAQSVRLKTKNGKMILESQDGTTKERSVAVVEMDGNMTGSVILNVKHLHDAVSAGVGESVRLERGTKVVEVSDDEGWEVLMMKEKMW